MITRLLDKSLAEKRESLANCIRNHTAQLDACPGRNSGSWLLVSSQLGRPLSHVGTPSRPWSENHVPPETIISLQIYLYLVDYSPS